MNKKVLSFDPDLLTLKINLAIDNEPLAKKIIKVHLLFRKL